MDVGFEGLSSGTSRERRKKKKMMKRKMIEKLGRGRRAEMGGGEVPAVLSIVVGEGMRGVTCDSRVRVRI